jgi:uracil-DNA glycosylase family 4
MFTGDRSGDWLYRALFQHGFANQPHALHRNDDLRLIDCYITAVLHCAPPSNKPTPQEISNCRPYLQLEWERLTKVRVVLALGRIAFDSVWALHRGNATIRRPRFRHGLEVPLAHQRLLVASFHPSQQNTFTGKLTQPMFDSVFWRIRQVIDAS